MSATPTAAQVREEIADHLAAIADLIAGCGFTPDELGFKEDTAVEDIRAEVATYREKGRLP